MTTIDADQESLLRRTDVRVATTIMGLRVVGWEYFQPMDYPLYYPRLNGSGPREPFYQSRNLGEAPPPFHHLWSEEDPNHGEYVRQERLDYEAEIARWGCTAADLSAVPHYTTKLADAWLVVERMREMSEESEIFADRWAVAVDAIDLKSLTEAEAAHRICMAALSLFDRIAE